MYSASARGPRGQAGLSPQWLSSVENAIWVCETHGKLVDNNRGKEYPPAVLVGYKALHEMRIIRRQRGITAPLGWFHEICVRQGPIFDTPVKVTFGKVTFLFGDNGTGKSALWEWLAALADPRWSLRRWRTQLRRDPPLEFRTTYFDPVRHTVDVAVSSSGDVGYRVDSQDVMFHPFPTRFVTVRRPESTTVLGAGAGAGEAWDRMDDLERIAATLRVDVLQVENALSRVPNLGVMVKGLWIKEQDEADHDEEKENEEDSRREIIVKFGPGHELPFSSLSSSEQIEVLIEIGVTLAMFWAQYVPTVLIFAVTALDRPALVAWAKRLLGADYLFQTIIELPEEPTYLNQEPPGNWEVVSLSGRPPKVKIHQVGADVDE
jgi:hypothetical protein